MSAEATGDRTTETIPQWKRDEVDAIVDVIESHESVGVVDVTGIPSRQLQTMRQNLHGLADLRIGRNTLIRRALDEVDEGVETLTDVVSGQVGLIVTDDNPFALYRELEASKSPAPISAGEIAPNEIVIPEGDTGVDPGPFVGELQNVGAAARIQEGSIHVTERSVVCAEGEAVSAELEGVLAEMGIEPKEVGLDLRAVYADGVRFEPDELAIDVDEYRADVQQAAARARNLSVNAAHPTDSTVEALLAIGDADAAALGLDAAVASPHLASDLVAIGAADHDAVEARVDDPVALGDVESDGPTDDDDGAAADEDADDSDDPDADGDGADDGDQPDADDGSAPDDADDGSAEQADDAEDATHGNDEPSADGDADEAQADNNNDDSATAEDGADTADDADGSGDDS
jgi:large subunit ribosomal protein L10